MTAKEPYGLLINYGYCTGCHSCEVSCQMEHDLPIDRWGIKLSKTGPWEIEDGRYQYDFVPVPTDQCNLCAERTVKGKKPLCVLHCQASVMQYGPVSELAASIDGTEKSVLFVPKAGLVD